MCKTIIKEIFSNNDKCLGIKTYLWSKTATGLELAYLRCSETYYRNHIIPLFSWLLKVSRHSPPIFSTLLLCPHPPVHFHFTASAFSPVLSAVLYSYMVTRASSCFFACYSDFEVWSGSFMLAVGACRGDKKGENLLLSLVMNCEFGYSSFLNSWPWR